MQFVGRTTNPDTTLWVGFSRSKLLFFLSILEERGILQLAAVGDNKFVGQDKI